MAQGGGNHEPSTSFNFGSVATHILQLTGEQTAEVLPENPFLAPQPRPFYLGGGAHLDFRTQNYAGRPAQKSLLMQKLQPMTPPKLGFA